MMLLLVLSLNLCIVDSNSTPGTCPITPVNGFMKRVCAIHEYQCMASTNVTYTTQRRANMLTRKPIITLSTSCPDDPSSYQACGLGYLSFTNPYTFDFDLLASPPYCGYLYPRDQSPAISTPAYGIQTSLCTTTEESTFEIIELEGPQSIGIYNGSACDLICDDIPLEKILSNIGDHDRVNNWCFDEIQCGGNTYGIRCESEFLETIMPLQIHSERTPFIHPGKCTKEHPGKLQPQLT